MIWRLARLVHIYPNYLSSPYLSSSIHAKTEPNYVCLSKLSTIDEILAFGTLARSAITTSRLEGLTSGPRIAHTAILLVRCVFAPCACRVERHRLGNSNPAAHIWLPLPWPQCPRRIGTEYWIRTSDLLNVSQML